MCWENDGTWTQLGGGTNVARKQHRCDQGCVIQPGQRYHWGAGLGDGEFYSWKECEPCHQASIALGAACRLYDPYSTDPPIGMLLDAYHEHLDLGELEAEVVPDDLMALLHHHHARLKTVRADTFGGEQ